MLKSQFFGIEIETTGITREEAAKAVAAYFRTNAQHTYSGYDTWEVTDGEGKVWKLMSDASIYTERKISGKKYEAAHNKQYAVELVSPKLEYAEMEKLQEVVRTIRKAGAKVNTSCGIHIHVDGANHTAKTLKNLLGIMYAKEDLLFKSLKVDNNRVYYCKKTREDVLTKVRTQRTLTMDTLRDIWYGKKNAVDNTHQHYDESRYHALNLHAMFSKGTVEFRLFNSTLHAGEIKSYVVLALAISAQAIRQKGTQINKTASDNEKFTFRTWLLRLGLIGDEFTNVREHLLKNLDGNAAWRYAPENYPTHPQNHTTLAGALA